jgi:large repetitive protein
MCESPVNIGGLADGQHSFEVRAIDLAGNTDSSPAAFTWIIDLLPPETTITAAPPLISGSPSATFEFTGSDNATSPGELKFECRLLSTLDPQPSTPFTPCSSPQNFTGLSDGSHTFEVRAIDTVGHVDPTPRLTPGRSIP